MAENTPEEAGPSSGAPLARSTPGTARMATGATRGNAMEPQRDREGTLSHVIETLLDKGLVINADIMVSVAGVELLGIRIRAALASFETAARYGLEFPAGTDRDTVAWNEAIEQKETCPECGKRAPLQQLLNEFCPWCGWKSAQALEAAGNGQSAGGASGSNSSTASGDSGTNSRNRSVGTKSSSSGNSSSSSSGSGNSSSGRSGSGSNSRTGSSSGSKQAKS